jgi:hypothetical protein
LIPRDAKPENSEENWISEEEAEFEGAEEEEESETGGEEQELDEEYEPEEATGWVSGGRGRAQAVPINFSQRVPPFVPFQHPALGQEEVSER